MVDLGGATLLPGLIDCHTHITGQPSNYYEDIFRRSPIDYAVTAHVYARRALEAGFTTIRDLGSGEFIDVAFRNAADPRGWGDRVGAVEPGRYADLVAVSGDPLADVTALSGRRNFRF